jgi:hypothetical protein
MNIHLTLSYQPFNIECHLGCHLDENSFNTDLTSSVNAPLTLSRALARVYPMK